MNGKLLFNLLIFMAVVLGGIVAIAAVTVQHPWPALPLVFAGGGLGLVAWLVLTDPRVSTKRISARAAVVGYAVVLFVTTLLSNASDIQVVTGVAVAEGLLLPLVWKALAFLRRQGYPPGGGALS